MKIKSYLLLISTKFANSYIVYTFWSSNILFNTFSHTSLNVFCNMDEFDTYKVHIVQSDHELLYFSR